MKIIRWFKRLFRKEPPRTISAADLEEAIARAQTRMARDLEHQIFAPSPLLKAINGKEGVQ